MADYRRWRVAGGTYFFTVVTHERRCFLTDDLSRGCLREAIRQTRAERPFGLDAIVLLPDHLHAIWTLPEGDSDYSTRWQLINRRFTASYLDAGGDEATRAASREAKRERRAVRRSASEACGSGDFGSTRAAMQ